jgi:iron complex transport system ATP-binding protein
VTGYSFRWFKRSSGPRGHAGNGETADLTPVLEARRVSFAYRQPVVHEFSLALRKGEVTGIIGPNGCGKTTVLKLLNGILTPRSGEVLLDGTRPMPQLSRKEIAGRIAMVPQSPGFLEEQTVFQFALQGRSPHLSLLGFESRLDEEITSEALETTRMLPYAHARVAEISGGERQRLLLARALVQRTPVLLLDEFTANLDIRYQIELMQLVAQVTREKRLATAVVSHEINLLAAIVDHIVLMSRGRIIRQGPVGQVVTRESLRSVFGIDFEVRMQPGGTAEIVPVFRKGTHHES